MSKIMKNGFRTTDIYHLIIKYNYLNDKRFYFLRVNNMSGSKLYNNEKTVKVYGFKYPVIDDSIKTAIVHDLDINKFKTFIKDLISTRGNIDDSTAYKLIDDAGADRMKMAFTHSSMMGNSNYEFFEMLGDRSVNKAIIWYMYRRFPEMANHEKSAMYMTALKRKYENKTNFGLWSRKLGFAEYIRYTELDYVQGKYINRVSMDSSMLEDCFEAFCGCLEDLIDSRIGLGVGYGVIYNIISTLLDEEYITTDLTKLIDTKTQLKETIENASIKKIYGGSIEYNIISDQNKQFIMGITLKFTNSPCKKYSGGLTMQFQNKKPYLKKVDAENDVAKQVLEFLEKECSIRWLELIS